MKLTKRKALELCRDLWAWLARNPKKDKADWPKWRKLWPMPSWCPCCANAEQARNEYDNETGILRSRCDFCPMIAHWPQTCFVRNTDFKRWQRGKGQIRIENARSISNAARRELRKLKG